MDKKMITQKTLTKSQVIAIAAIFLALAATACTRNAPQLNAKPNIELIQDMMDQPALKPQDYMPNDPNKAAARLPPEHTVPIGYKPYPYHLNPEEAQAKLRNPYSGNMSPEVLELGRAKYDIYCAVCHGYEGKGDGPVAPKMALKPPSLVAGRTPGLNDGGIYHIITDGQGVMSSYAYQMPNDNDRWAIVNYVRSLQKMAGATPGKAGAAAPGQGQ
jgi:mono/diheme cytochrome c family protein